ncbi:MAG: hypothetical protein Kow002_18730 [Anaerolineales bacterium]
MANEVIDLDTYRALEEMVGEAYVLEMVDAFLDEGKHFLDDLNSALNTSDVDRFRRAAHSLKSNAATFGALHLSGLAKELEEIARDGQLEGSGGKLESISSAFGQAEQALKDIQNG